jgi:hypothetical protein
MANVANTTIARQKSFSIIPTVVTESRQQEKSKKPKAFGRSSQGSSQ